MTRRTALAPILGTTILGTAMLLAAWPESPPDAGSRSDSQRQVLVAEVTSGSHIRTVRLAGVTRAVQRAELSFVSPARLASRPVETGDVVAPGQVLASLDNREYVLAEQAAAASLAELEVRLAQANRDLERVRRLAEARAATDEEFEQTSAATAALAAARDAASAQLGQTRRLLAESVLRAPFAGTVTAVHVEPGEWVGPGRPVVELAGAGAVEVVVEAPETVQPHLAAGQPAVVSLPLAGLDVSGRITNVAGAVAGAGQLFLVEVEIIDDNRILPGLAAEVVLEIPIRAGLTVPLEAVVNPGSSRPTVYRIRDSHARRIAVELGQVLGDRVAVSGELSAGDLVAVSGHVGLADGDEVEVF